MAVTPHLLMLPDRRNFASREQLLGRVRAEYDEMPCLRLTCRQAQRLFGLRPDVCERVLATLVGERTLTRGPDERFGVQDDLGWPTRMSRAAGLQRSVSRAS